MEYQTYANNQSVYLLDAISNQPLALAVIISFNSSNQLYRIRYQISGDETFWVDDVPESRLLSVL
jgi:hypothetical protein